MGFLFNLHNSKLHPKASIRTVPHVKVIILIINVVTVYSSINLCVVCVLSSAVTRWLDLVIVVYEC